jgi:hypothetical protein
MKKSLLLFLLLAPALPGAARAQTFDFNNSREPVAWLDGLWRFHTGDNPQWADPSFDDSQWPLLRSDESWAAQGYKGYSGLAWYRFRVNIPAGMGDLSITLPSILTNYEVYANGQKFAAFGKMPPNPIPYSNWSDQTYSLPLAPSSPRQIVIAIRVWQWPSWAGYEGGGPAYSGAHIGVTPEVQRLFVLFRAARFWSFSSTVILSFLQSLAAIAVFLLFLLRRSEREYLWFSLFLAFSAIQGWAGLYETMESARILLINPLMYTLGFPCAGLAQLAFYRRLLKARRTAFYWASLACLFAALAYGLLVILITVRVSSPFVFFLIFSLTMLPGYIWILFLLIARARQNFVDARLLLAPALLQISAVLFQWAAIITYVLDWQRRLHFHITLTDRPFPIELVQVGNLLFLLGVLAILILRFTRTRSQEERFAAEVQSARNVQQYLIPEHLPDTPGLGIESVYRPSREVGGDFFQVLPHAADGSALIVVGDVAGKGMQAGMLATLIVGAIRTAASFTNDPGQILSLLNERMNGRGLATCLALRIERDGSAVLANAGHLPPYLNGKELPMEGALPLGAVPGIDFPLLPFKLSPGDSLMLMTDGVAEAQDAAGQFFGFDRIAEMLGTGIAASALATAAQTFGQEDDITVLTVARAAVAL